MKLSDKLFSARTENKLSKQEVANRLNMDVTTYGRVESGKRNLEIDKLKLLPYALGIDAKEILELLDIEPIRQRKGVSLSGGERRRTEIARALVSKPKFLLLDEPFAGVDPIAVKDIQEIIHQLTKINIGVLITDHNVRETLEICDRAYVMKAGSLLASGTSTEIKNNPEVRKHYLGKSFNF